MRTDSDAFLQKNNATSKIPIYVVELSFDDAYTDLHYFTSNKIAALPTTASNIYHGYINTISGTSQQLDPINFQSTIGNISFSVVDYNSNVTSLLNTKLQAGYGTRHKRVRVYVGYKGLTWDDYSLIATQLVENKTEYRGLLTFNCVDVQRLTKSDIFDLYSTRLASELSYGSIYVNTSSSYPITNFDTLEHGPSYSDAPNETVGYIKLNNEIIRWTSKNTNQFVVDSVSSLLDAAITGSGSPQTFPSTITLSDASGFPDGGNKAYGCIIEGGTTNYIRWTGVTGSPLKQLTGVTGITNSFTTSATVYWAKGRGALDTVATTHTIDSGADDSNKPVIDEFVYIEVPVVQLIYGLYTGTLYNTGGNITLPDNWHLSVSTDYVSLAHFTAMNYYGIWDTSNDAAENNIICRVIGEKKQDGKKFIETQLLPLIGGFIPVLADGQLGLSLMQNVLSRAPYVDILDESNVVEYSELLHDDSDVHNVFNVEWNWNAITNKPTRKNVLADTSSLSIHKETTPINMQLRELHGSRHTLSTLYSILNFLRDRYAGPPIKMSVKTLHKMNYLNVGDPVRVRLDNVRDINNANLTLNRTFEVIGKEVDWITGDVSLKLFGSTQKGAPITEYTTSTAVMSAGYWTSSGTNLNTNPGGITTSLTGGVLHITGSGTLTGNADINNTGAIYYSDVPIQVDSGVQINITNNVQFRINGNCQINGSINGKGAGASGASSGGELPGTPGGYGYTRSSGGILVVPYNQTATWYSTNRVVTQPTTGEFNTGLTALALNNGGTTLAGIPTSLMGSGGGAGRNVYNTPIGGGTAISIANGGAGGDGGAGFAIVCESLSFGASGYIDLSGDDGTAGVKATFTDTYFNSLIARYGSVYSGSGAGGYPGGLYVLLTSNAGFATDLETKFIANRGACPLREPFTEGLIYGFFTPFVAGNVGYQSYYTGDQAEDLSDAGVDALGYSTNPMYFIQYVPDNLTAEEDVSDITGKPSAITIAAAANTKNTLNVVTLEISVTPPADGNYYASEVSIAVSGTNSWQVIGTPKSTDEVLFLVPADGTTYDVKAQPVSKNGVKSEDYIQKSYTVTSALTVRNAPSGKIVFGDDDPASNGGIILSDAGLAMYDTGGTQTVDIDSSDGSFDFGDTTSENYISYNPATPSLTMGKDVKFEGGNAYKNDGFLYHTIFDSLDAFNTTTAGASSSVAITASSGALTLTTDTGATDYAHINRKFYYTLTSLTWANSRKYKFRIGAFSLDSTTCELYIGIGVYTINGIYVFYDNGTWKGVAMNGGTPSTVTFSSTPVAGDILEMVFTPAVSAEFYVNGTSQGTVTTNLPTGSLNSPDVPFYAVLRRTTSGDGSTRNVSIGEWKYLEN